MFAFRSPHQQKFFLNAMALSSVNYNALLSSLVEPPPRAPKLAPPAPPANRGGEAARLTLNHMMAQSYPVSLLADYRGIAPGSVSEGLRMRTRASAHRRDVTSCPVAATPARMSACEEAKTAADAALLAYRESDAFLFGDADGLLQEVVDRSLEMNDVCSVDDLYDHQE